MKAGQREQVQLLVLWARLVDDNPWPQFVAAFTEGEVDCWPEMHKQRRAEAEQWFSDFGRRPGETTVVEFFTTWETLDRPPFPVRELVEP